MRESNNAKQAFQNNRRSRNERGGAKLRRSNNENDSEIAVRERYRNDTEDTPAFNH